MINFFDVIVIGGGHAGTEASYISSTIGCKTLLITNDINKIGIMSCNPSIGGIGKSHLVKEIDAMGGLMARAADRSGINFKILNSSKGYAVRSTRIQVDRNFYSKTIYYFLKNQDKLTILQKDVSSLIIKNNTVFGVITKDGLKFKSKVTILATGTFFNACIYIGNSKKEGGRIGDNSSKNLPKFLKKFPFKIERLKTGTPPRILKNTINFKNLDKQESDYSTTKMSFFDYSFSKLEQKNCYITHTNDITHEIIRENIKHNSINSLKLKGIGPRYCLSIEDKVFKFPDKFNHQIFLEPEGIFSREFYPNGISMSFPLNIQIKIIRSIKGLEKACITKPAYTVEYDFFNPEDLKKNLESKIIKNLFLAGQINGTTGYEEAAAQGLIAGINAARTSLNLKSWIPKRNNSYLGVLIDDLCSKKIKEPYRMFTSRSEYRLFLREDNADIRLTPIARKLNTINDFNWKNFNKKNKLIEKEKNNLKNTFIYPLTKESKILKNSYGINIDKKTSFFKLLKNPLITYDKLLNFKIFKTKISDKNYFRFIESEIKYEGYIKKQRREVKKIELFKDFNIPKNINYNLIPGLSNEVIENIKKYKPLTFYDLNNTPGITKSAIYILSVWMKKLN
ncbi:MAG: tRNA uridine-5-carboxymethylaminomethyl(34) synthesis enzyme MnmG [Enterobacteriaceae bacterium]